MRRGPVCLKLINLAHKTVDVPFCSFGFWAVIWSSFRVPSNRRCSGLQMCCLLVQGWTLLSHVNLGNSFHFFKCVSGVSEVDVFLSWAPNILSFSQSFDFSLEATSLPLGTVLEAQVRRTALLWERLLPTPSSPLHSIAKEHARTQASANQKSVVMTQWGEVKLGMNFF